MNIIGKIYSQTLFPKTVYKGHSVFNGDIRVIRLGHTYKLTVNNFVQSFDKSSKFARKRVWGQIANTVYQEKPNVKNILLLGMGAGTLLHFLNEKLQNDNLNIISVEVDELIVNVARKYFALDTIPNNTVVTADACEVVKNPRKYNVVTKPDCIIVDTYCGNKYPKNIANKGFLENLKNLADKKALIIFNRVIPRAEKNKIKEYEKEISTIIQPVKIFKVNCHASSDNYIFYGKLKS